MFSVRSLRAGVLLIGLVLVVLTLAPSLASAQAPTIAITNLALTCSNVNVSYSVSNVPTGETYVLIRVDGPSGQVGSTSGGAANGSHSASANFDPPQPDNTTLTVTVTLYNAGEPLAADSRTQNCSGGTPPQPPSEPVDTSGWPGDSRLSPDRAEYYTIYCAFDQVEVWRSNPSGLLLDTIALTSVMNLDGCTTSGTGLSVCRSGDTVTIIGSNGNAAPAAGSKSFSLNACYARNGGAPVEETVVTVPDEPNPQPVAEETVEDPIDYCATKYKGDSFEIVECLVETATASSEVVWASLMNCLPTLFMVTGGPMAVGYRHQRRRAKRPHSTK